MIKRIHVGSDSSHPTITYGVDDCRSLLERTTGLVLTDLADEADVLISFAVGHGLSESEYSVAVHHGARTEIRLTGHDETCALHALYEMLEKAGIFFDILGPVLPDTLNLGDLEEGESVTTPFVRRRGIRQHINFAMDISSYPLAEALEYLRNLARMRMNHITFHCYRGQWFGYLKDDVYQPGGNFFYGTRHVLPQRELFTRAIRNRSVYCIPEIEAIVDRPEERGKAAAEWLNAVIAECKRLGMHVQLSIETLGDTYAEDLAICREALRQYPVIDTLELITPECGNSVTTIDVEELKSCLTHLFGAGILDAALLESLKPNLEQLEGGLRHCARNIRLASDLQSEGDPRMPSLAVGAYITCPDSLRILLAVMERCSPSGVSLAFLPAHGARRAVANLRQMGFTPESIGRSMLYSWIEFDGNMYLQQNSVTGTAELLRFAKEISGDDQVAGVALNHWRTAENRVCIAYAGRAFIQGPIQPRKFYHEYAAAFGIENAEKFADVMQELDELDDLARERLFNIGFCASICWVRPGLRWTEKWHNPSIDVCRNRFRVLIRELEDCLQSATTPQGRQVLRFLENRIECSIHQLDCAQTMKSLSAFCDHDQPEALTDQQRRVVSETCDRAMDMAQDYLSKHAEAIVDRGCEGTLISYQTTVPNFIDHIRAVFVHGETECSHILPQFDEPPPPLTS